MKFIHLSDPHLVAEGQALNGSVPTERLDACLADIQAWHGDADFVVISGDLAENGAPEAYIALRNRLQDIALPYFLLIGNHDDRTNFLQVFGDHPRDPHGFVQCRHDTEDGVFLFLDTSADSPGQHAGCLCEDRLAWLGMQLDQAGDRPTYIFMHHPPFDVGMTVMDPIKLADSDRFRDTLQHGDDIRQVFHGHLHRMICTTWHGISFVGVAGLNHQMPMVAESVDGMFCNEPPAYAVITLEADQMTTHFTTFLGRRPLHQG